MLALAGIWRRVVQIKAFLKDDLLVERGCAGSASGSAPAACGVLAVQLRRGLIMSRLGPLGFDSAQQSPTTRTSVERTAEKAFLLPGRV